MAGMHLQQQHPLAMDGWPGWDSHFCLPLDQRMRTGFSAPRGHLVDNPRVEAVLQGILLFGPSVFLLIGAPIRIFQLYRAKLVTVPNYRGLAKAVSEPYIDLCYAVVCMSMS